MTALLRQLLGYQGLVQTDWGMHHLEAILAGADIVGGAAPRDIQRIVSTVPEDRLDDSVFRILVAKFRLGLFEQPYVDIEKAEKVVGAPEHVELALEAAVRSLTLLKNDGVLPIKEKSTILVTGPLAEDVNALNSGWKCRNQSGQSVLEAVSERAALAGCRVISDVERVEEVDLAVLVLGEPTNTHQPAWGAGKLELPDEQLFLVERAALAGVPIIGVIIMGRPLILTSILEKVKGLLIAYRPGISAGAKAIALALFGDSDITGTLPWELPRSMTQVLKQREDQPSDIDEPLFERGYGLRLEGPSSSDSE